jgi:hypothetical protein
MPPRRVLGVLLPESTGLARRRGGGRAMGLRGNVVGDSLLAANQASRWALVGRVWQLGNGVSAMV